MTIEIKCKQDQQGKLLIILNNKDDIFNFKREMTTLLNSGSVEENGHVKKILNLLINTK